MIEIGFYLIFALFTIIIFRKKEQALPYIIILNSVVDLSIFWLGRQSIPGIFRAVALLLFIALSLKHIDYKKFKFLFVFLMYSFILVLFSTEFLTSLRGFSQIFLSMMMLPIGYSLIKNELMLQKISYSLIVVVFIAVIASAAGQFIGVGYDFAYSKDLVVQGFNDGLLGSGRMYPSALAIFLIPVTLRYIPKISKKVFVVLQGILMYLFIILTIRRTPIILPLIGYTFLFLKLKLESKGKLVVNILIAVLILFLISLPFSEEVARRFEARKITGKFDKDFYYKEARYQENLYLLEDMLDFNNPVIVLFGEKIFATGTEAGRVVGRMLHTDIGVLLDGAGLIGFLIYSIFVINLFIFFKPKKHLTNNSKYYRIYGIALLIISVAIALNGSFYNISFRSLIFIFIGGFARLYHESTKKMTITEATPIRNTGKM